MTDGSDLLPTARPDFDQRDVDAVAEVLASRWLGPGRVVDRFEAELRDRTGAAHVCAVATGTAALHLGLLALGIGPGDEVLMPPVTFVASAQAVLAVGAVPTFGDIDAATGVLDRNLLSRAVTPATRALLPVHYGGHVETIHPSRVGPAPLHVVEDAAHAFGSTIDGRPCGETSEVACFSFDPIKPLTCGQGGAVATSDPELARRVRRAADLGIAERGLDGTHAVEGFGLRYRMSDLNAAIGLAQLGRFDERADRRREIWTRYAAACRSLPGVTALAHDPAAMVPFLFALRVTSRRDQLRVALAEDGIGSGVHYPPLHRLPTFRPPGEPVSLPASEAFADEVVTLPFYPGLTDDDVERVIGSLTRAVARADAEPAA